MITIMQKVTDSMENPLLMKKNLRPNEQSLKDKLYSDFVLGGLYGQFLSC